MLVQRPRKVQKDLSHARRKQPSPPGNRLAGILLAPALHAHADLLEQAEQAQPRACPSASTSMMTESPSLMSPLSMRSAMLSSSSRMIARRSGRAPYDGLYPSSTRRSCTSSSGGAEGGRHRMPQRTSCSRLTVTDTACTCMRQGGTTLQAASSTTAFLVHVWSGLRQKEHAEARP